MRIKQIELLKYGKFDGETVDFPNSEFDFHFVVGPNEAGKSTLRTAISELLFGMPLRTDLGFKHPLPELRLGGTLEGETGETVFHRVRGRAPLRTPSGAMLPDDYLSHLLGTVDKSQFEKMYCLDHEQLVDGGKSILDGSKEVGRVLFQSAAGVTSLGPVRERLEKQAGILWARRGGSEYATAAACLAEATTELKSAQVKTKVWMDAKAALDIVQEEIAAENDKRLELEVLRSKLERVRRLSGHLLKLSAKSAELAEFGDVAEMPPNAMLELTAGSAELSAAAVVLAEREKATNALRATREAISFDGTLVALKKDIEALDSMRSAFSNHAKDLPIRQAEVDRHVVTAQTAAKQIGWPLDEAEMRSRQPTALSLKTVTKLLTNRGAVNQSARNAETVVREKTDDLNSYRADLEMIAGADIPDELRTAHADALTFRDSAAKQRMQLAAVKSGASALEIALAALEPWRVELDALSAMNTPSGARIQSLLLQSREAQSEVVRARDALQTAQAEVARLKLQARQFERANKVVTPTQVHEARTSRESTWKSIKDSSISLLIGAPMLDASIRLADELVDAQLGTATEAATLASLRQGLETAEEDLVKVEHALSGAIGRLKVFDEDCQAMLVSAGLGRMPLEDVPEWLAKREAALLAHATLGQLKRDLDDELHAAARTRSAIVSSLATVGKASAESEDLATLTARVTAYIGAADTARTRKDELAQLVVKSERALAAAKAAAMTITEVFQEWQSQWIAALDAAGLGAASATFAEAEGAVELANTVATSLKDADELRRSRIDAMKSDLGKLEESARRLATMVAPKLLDLGDWSAVSLQLAQQLREALASEQRAKDAEENVARAESDKAEAELKVQAAGARLKPLLDLAGAASVADAMPVIVRSDRSRALRFEIAESTDALLRDGDGLSSEAIKAEIAEYAPAEVIGLHENAKADSQELSERVNLLIQRRVAAEQAFSAIAGQANGAIAEAKRQEALATMGEVAEQYLEVATAGKLLKWAIDRYRDKKQAPMLLRASAIFATLTLGSFSNLVVDYEQEVPALSAKRSSGQVVEVSGLSEGTRDQLFMALRIAAIELQLESTKALPFVADDLFINFDDERSVAGLEALRELSKRTQVIFLTHHSHLVPLVQRVFGSGVNAVELQRENSFTC